jgi:hypothetical protein
MPQVIEPEQVAALGHRLHFFGRPGGSETVSWQYRNQAWFIERPDDGEESRPEAVVCEMCGKTLTYTVHSVEVTRRRIARMRLVGWLLMPVALIGLIGFSRSTRTAGSRSSRRSCCSSEASSAVGCC